MNSSYLQHSFCFRVPRRRTVTPLPSNHCRMRKSSLRWGLGKWYKWWLGLKIYWMILNRVEIHLDGEEKEAELKTIIFSLILLSFFSFQFLNPLPFTLVWASILTQKKMSFYLLIVAQFFDLVRGIEVYFWVKSINELFFLVFWDSPHALCWGLQVCR